MQKILPSDLSHRDRHQLLLSGVAPRPIALVSTVDEAGVGNISPFSFFNAYGSKPPILAIGPAISAKTGATKDTWRNIMATKQCTVNVCTYSMVEAINLASAEYPPDVDEFEKCGLSRVNASIVTPPLVRESPYSMECVLMENIELRRDIGGNGNIMLLEVVCFHVSDSIMHDGQIDPRRMDLIARMGHDYYCRISPHSIFEVHKPGVPGIGVDALPEHIRTSVVLTGNHLAKLAGVQYLPMLDGSFPQFAKDFRADSVQIELEGGRPDAALFVLLSQGKQRDRGIRHKIAAAFLDQNKISEAWQTLLLE
ncbi:MAG: flavin reductase family protein [Ignavibacteria bacterium]|nr:flavin reductase family protein [Ignavibacteria bacterium]